jgi:hypothetical protein
MFVKLWHQSHAVFPDDPSRFIAVFVILESVINRHSCHPNINGRVKAPQNSRYASMTRLKSAKTLDDVF